MLTKPEKNKDKYLFPITMTVFAGVIIAGICYMYFGVNLAGECRKTLINEVTSSSSPYSAQTLLVGCGATGGEVTWISVRNVNSQSQQRMIVVDGNQAKTCDVIWKDSTNLSVTCNEVLSETFSYNPDFENMHMTYHSTPK
jgi:hypothetical protein